ncbi:MAG: RtcB family protein [Burkholderiales bacterium]|nr:RtcB family protein [Burkholderiales bacterium]
MPISIRKSVPNGKDIFVWTKDIDEKSLQQLINVASLPFIFKHVAAMPDVHAGDGATIGSVIATQGAVIPAAVGVDIGCGMLAAKTNLSGKDMEPCLLQPLMDEILKRIPVGLRQHDPDKIHWDAVEKLRPGFEEMNERVPGILSTMKRTTWEAGIGTLGAGNHFLEISKDTENNVWIMLHSGSRGPGLHIAVNFFTKAKKLAEQTNFVLPDPELAWLTEGTKDFDDYLFATHWAQQYAHINREEMLNAVLESLKVIWPTASIINPIINCHHNYVRKENHFGEDVWVTRKGAVSASSEEFGIIPGSMGTRSFITKGKGELNSFKSSSHGAGRRLSRTEAKRTFGVEDLEKQTAGVLCRKDVKVIDEIPAAYKDIDVVMQNQSDLVEPVAVLKQILCVKG